MLMMGDIFWFSNPAAWLHGFWAAVMSCCSHVRKFDFFRGLDRLGLRKICTLSGQSWVWELWDWKPVPFFRSSGSTVCVYWVFGNKRDRIDHLWRTYIDSVIADPTRTWSWNQHSFEWIQGICSYIGMLQGAFRYGAFSSGGWSWSGIFKISFIKFLLTANYNFKDINFVLCIFDFVEVVLGFMDS